MACRLTEVSAMITELTVDFHTEASISALVDAARIFSVKASI